MQWFAGQTSPCPWEWILMVPQDQRPWTQLGFDHIMWKADYRLPISVAAVSPEASNHCTWQVLWKEQPPLQHIEVQRQGVPSDAGWNSESLCHTVWHLHFFLCHMWLCLWKMLGYTPDDGIGKTRKTSPLRAPLPSLGRTNLLAARSGSVNRGVWPLGPTKPHPVGWLRGGSQIRATKGWVLKVFLWKLDQLILRCETRWN